MSEVTIYMYMNFVLPQITRSSFGEVVTVPLVPGGSSKPVTLENRTEYVHAYIKYVLDDAVSEPFMAFDEGFRRVCDGKVLVSRSYVIHLVHLLPAHLHVQYTVVAVPGQDSMSPVIKCEWCPQLGTATTWLY